MKTLTERQQAEVEKYTKAFIHGTNQTKNIYGHFNWGKNVYPYISQQSINSLLDIGCGHGVFVNDMAEKFNIPNVYGLDIASVRTGKHIQNDKIHWIDSQAHDIPLEDNSIEYITSFDCLEHALEEDVDSIVDEFYRVCTKQLILKIAYHQATERSLDGEILHMTVKPEGWWIEKFSRKFTLNQIFDKNYLIFNK